MQQILITRAVIQQDQKILILRRAVGDEKYQGLYELPGGKVDFGEDPKGALRREVQEEVGCDLETMQLHEVYSYVDVHDSEKQYVILTFLATLQAGQTINLGVEHNKYAWKKLSDIQLNEITDMTRTILQLDVIPETTDEEKIKTSKSDANISTKTKNAIIYCDGGSRGNPGPSASGFVILDDREKLLFEGGRYLGITTNNQAEYQAVKLALDKALDMGIRNIQFRLDSQLVVNQLNGIYQIRNRDLWPIYAYIKETAKKFNKVVFTHVRREFNKEADAMVNKILDEYK